jgi:hypothetical protein
LTKPAKSSSSQCKLTTPTLSKTVSQSRNSWLSRKLK